MANSYTGTINTHNEFVKVSEVADFTFTEGNIYTMQIQNGAYIKISDAIFYVYGEKFSYKATSSDLYIKTSSLGCVLTILENE